MPLMLTDVLLIGYGTITQEVVISIGVLADRALNDRLRDAAVEGGSQLR